MLDGEEVCLFCNTYCNETKQHRIIFENSEAYSVLNYKPSTPGHALIITKQHITTLSDISGVELEGFIHAIPQTFKVIQEIYKQNPESIVDFYKELIENPPEEKSVAFAKQMLDHPHLLINPIAYNWGMNYGYEAGQREIHLHIHLFPRREMGLGIATAMRKHLAKI